MQKYALGYARTSTDLQVNGLQAQVLALDTHFKSNGIEHYQIITDEGFSGTKAQRPGLEQLVKAVERGEVSAVVVYSFSRFARSVKHLLDALELFDKHHVAFVSLSENLDTRNSMGKFVFTVIAAMSSLEREVLVERVKSGLINARSKGKTLGRKRTRPSELIQTLYSKGMSYRAIAQVAKVSIATVAEELKATRRSEMDNTERSDAFG